MENFFYTCNNKLFDTLLPKSKPDSYNVNVVICHLIFKYLLLYTVCTTYNITDSQFN